MPLPVVESIPTDLQRSAIAVRNLILTATGLICLAGASYFLGSATGAGEGKTEDVAHRIGLIDMAFVFEEYDKVKVLREDLKDAHEEAETKGKEKYRAIQELKQELSNFKEGAPDYVSRESKLASLASQFETFRQVTKRELARKEAKLVHTVYLEIQDAVEKLAKHNGYTMVLRFSREELNSTDPQKVAQVLARPVIYHRKRDDMTDAVLKMLNNQYNKDAPPSAATAPRKSPVQQVKGESTRRGSTAENE
ncbi:MAG: OmpH family outer membrane protein [Planctomycetales bacterium]